MDNTNIKEILQFIDPVFLQLLLRVLILSGLVAIIGIVFTEAIKLIDIALTRKTIGISRDGKNLPSLILILINMTVITLSSLLLVFIFDYKSNIIYKIFNSSLFILIGFPFSTIGYNFGIKPAINYIKTWKTHSDTIKTKKMIEFLKCQKELLLVKVDLKEKIKELELNGLVKNVELD